MDGGAWWAAVHGVAKSRARLSDFTFTFHFHALEKEMAIHSSVLAWRIPGTEEPSGLPSMGSHRVRHDWSDLAAAAAVQSLNWVVCCVIISSGFKEKTFYVTKTKECRGGKKKKILSFLPPWESQTPISTSRAPDPFLLLGGPQTSYQSA